MSKRRNELPLPILAIGDNPLYARLAVDAQPTSFSMNTQFRFFDEIDDVSSGNQIVYKFNATNPVNVFLRSINLWEGGRRYLVYPADGNETFTGSFNDLSDQVYLTNGNLNEDISTPPISGVTVERAIGSSIFTTASKPRNGTAMLTDGNANRASSAYQANGDQGGVAENQSFYLVFDHIGSNNPTNGLFLLSWEELYPEG